jgi:RNA polymerase sigma-70 factor, ECF subfamily
VADPLQFIELRAVLFGIAYRMLGSAAEADDIVQEAYLRWTGVDDSRVESPRAYLTTIVTRLSIDHLRSARVRRESYHGQWLPEPIFADRLCGVSGLHDHAVHDPDREDPAGGGGELSDSLSMAFLVLLEELAPPERAAFLLREVFGYEYGEISRMLERNEPACRQLVSRARRRIGDRRKRFDADREQTRELTRRFVVACGTGDVDGLMSLLAEDVVIRTDGGGKTKAAPRPVVGPWRSARFLIHVAKSFSADTSFREAMLNGQPGLVFEENGDITSAVIVDVMGGRIAEVRVVANPEKLAALRSASSTQTYEPG